MLGLMAISVNTHFGPWTEEDLTGLPDVARGYELLEGTLLVKPLSGAPHQVVSGKLTSLLATMASPGQMVLQAMGVRLPGNTMLIPDVFVGNREVLLANTSGILDPTDVILVAEIVSPGSKIMDRLTKPALYADAGIPYYWRVELENGPAVFAYGLEGGRYVERGSTRPGERLTLNEPFAVSFDPADLSP
ncbi:MAG TPA: Uma2 family endonuclease [Isosphaeraceae bacterium]|nr:Uma2 family endonuclease [Isosphaeraceae bacterium]